MKKHCDQRCDEDSILNDSALSAHREDHFIDRKAQTAKLPKTHMRVSGGGTGGGGGKGRVKFLKREESLETQESPSTYIDSEKDRGQ